ncbi:hypothetical protein ACSUAE_15795 [Acinetobacter baumannii]
MPLPNKEQFTGSGVTEQGFKNAQDQLVDFLKYEVASRDLVDVLANTNMRQLNTFYYAPNNIIVKEANSALFAVSIKVQSGQKYVFNAKTFGVVGTYYIADSGGNVLQTLASNETLEQDYVIKIPQNGTMLYVNCLNNYADFKLYLLNNEFGNLSFANFATNDFQFYSNDNGIIVNANSTFFQKN